MGISISTMSIFWRVLTIFSLTIFGVVARKSGSFREEARESVANIIMNITLPSLIFVSMTSDITWERLVLGAATPLIGLLLVLLMMAVTALLGRWISVTDERRGTFMVLCSMPNSSFIAFPVVLSIFGQEGLAYAVLYDIGVTIAFCSAAILALQNGVIEKGSWKALINPSLVAMILALLVNRMGLSIPELVLVPFRIMGDATVPLAMLLMGYLLAGLGLRSNAISLELGVALVCKLLLYPLLAYLLMLPFNLDPLVRTVIIMEAAMPSMASAPVLVEKYGGDGEFAVTGVFVTTLLSMVTIPLVVGLLA